MPMSDSTSTSLRALKGRRIGRGLVELTRRNSRLALDILCDILGVPSKTQNHDPKNISVREIATNDEGTRTVPFERDDEK